MDNRASTWSLTINNPTSSDWEDLDHARQRGWKVEGQSEVGKDGTPHLQLLLRTPQVRFSAVKKIFRRAHIEPARNAAALSNYVNKEETRVAPLPTGSDSYPSMSKFWYLLAKKMNHNHPQWTANDKSALLHPDELSEENGHTPRRAYMYSDTYDRIVERDPLKHLDVWTEELIAEGYHVESLASNPAVRSAWKKWWRAIVYRAMETARQTDSVHLPTINVDTEEHNQLNADDHARTQAAPGVLERLDPDGESSEDEGGSEVSGTASAEGGCGNC